jgi:hypothetical protein
MRTLDRYLPEYHFVERHATHVRAPAAAVYRAIHELTGDELRLARPLFWLRALPARLLGRRVATRTQTHQTVLQTVLAGGFVLLDDQPDREIALGTIGRFWQLSGGGAKARVPEAAAFASFAEPTYAKAALDFRLEPSADGAATQLSTETRIFTPDPHTRRRFARYWRLIHPGSALIRLIWLRAIRRRAERSVLTARTPAAA